MPDDIKINDNLIKFTKVPLLLTIVFAVLDVLMYLIDIHAGVLGSVFVALYLIVLAFLMKSGEPRIYDELVEFAAQYNSVLKQMLEHFSMPIALTDGAGKMLWVNEQFTVLTDIGKDYRKSITSVFSGITIERLKKEEEQDLIVDYEQHSLRAHIHRICLEIGDTDKEEASGEPQEEPKKKKRKSLAADDRNAIYMIQLFDETRLMRAERENEDLKMIPGLIYIDNYEEIADTVEEVKQSLLLALADRKVNRYFASVDGLVKKIEKDKYFVVFRKQYLEELEENKFSLLEDIKSIRLGNESSMTLSMGLGFAGGSYAKNYEYARAAIELAIGRGGDQAVLKTGERVAYFGGNSEPVAKSTRVKARVKALALREIIIERDNFYIMGHSIADVDSFGAAIGIYCAARQLGKHAQIVLDEVNTSLRPICDCFTPENGYPEDLLISSEKALEQLQPQTALIVVDTNRPSYTESPQLLSRAKMVVVFDHHRIGEETIRGAVLSYIEPYASSTCEMIAEVLQYFDDDIQLNDAEADALYAGILIDTNNFMTKTGVRTFEAAAYLRRCGAETTRVRKLLRNDMGAYKARAEAIRHAEVYRNSFAISVCPADEIESPTVASAQAANELLNIVGIRASFVLTDYHGKIYISSRSIDEINVQRIMERLGGGGHMSTAGAQLANCSMEEAVSIIKNTIDEMIKEGDIRE
jgi:c-di-AMP phosphodiesterase-like protein